MPLPTVPASRAARVKAPLRYCAYPTCHHRVPHGYCPTHRAEKSKAHRYTQHPEYNTARWQRERDIYKAEHPMCVVCGRVQPIVVDHIVPTWVVPERFYDQTNWQTLCAQHNRLKADEDARTYRGQRRPMARVARVPTLA